ncbi:class I SAM-dependent methyltransferase [Francisella hispaniensis]|uniref:class I SAM-dependent methyltransferase n=1 Tax=Francisella hispaniensis TaxID=622488 RepID=UPI001907B3A1|nr:class I SAM-dependent methyltransferase [Francisella hispaniensis]MBK2357532.1 class I SAM-dependent methyltransferase [Francisella hispaniensis]
MNCPLCDTENIKKLEKIDKKSLIGLYKKATSEDFSYLISQDIDFCECNNCKLRFYDPLTTGDEKFYNSLQKFEWYYLDDKEEYVYAKDYISSTDKVLEVGSGKGAFAKHIDTKDYVGLDFSRQAKNMAQQNGIVVENELIEDYAEKHPHEFDVVVSFQVLEHVSNPKQFIESKIKTLKKGGRLIIAVPSEDSFLKYAINAILNMPPHHVTRWSDATFKYIADIYNLTIETIYHEKVQDVHKSWYLTTLIANSISANRIIDTSFFYKFKNKFAGLIGRFLSRGLKNEMLPNGHTVLVVYTK